MRILGIETSCDETGVAIYDNDVGLLSNELYSQVNLHSKYGGVVPELAARDHILRVVPLVNRSLFNSKLQLSDIDGIAYTAGPGLLGSLMVGATIGHSLAYSCRIPVIPVNHMEGHLLSPMLDGKNPACPFVALLVSGGHTQLVLVNILGKYKLLGESIDDAVGEVFDKVANLLGISYPGGALLSKLAQSGISGAYHFPRPMINKPDLNFSFSGLKTSVSNVIRVSNNDFQTKANLARAFEEAVVDTLVYKCCKALDVNNLNVLVVSGGVSANFALRKALSEMMSRRGGDVFYTRPEFCTDNGAMIAYAGMFRFRFGASSLNLDIKVKPRWSIDSL